MFDVIKLMCGFGNDDQWFALKKTLLRAVLFLFFLSFTIAWKEIMGSAETDCLLDKLNEEII